MSPLAHVSGLPVEELLPVAWGVGGLLVASLRARRAELAATASGNRDRIDERSAR